MFKSSFRKKNQRNERETRTKSVQKFRGGKRKRFARKIEKLSERRGRKSVGRRDATAAPPRKRRSREKVGFWSRRGERACRRRSSDRGTEGSRAVNCNKRESENFRKGERGERALRRSIAAKSAKGNAEWPTFPPLPLKITFAGERYS